MRIFTLHDKETNTIEWYFYAREGVVGPFLSLKESEKALEIFVSLNIMFNDDGGRSTKFATN